MVTIDQIADAALQRDNLLLRGLLSDFLREFPDVSTWLPPSSEDPRIQAVAASIAELVARHRQQHSPDWTENIPSIEGAFYLVKTADFMRGIRTLCDEQSPMELRKRGFLAPPDFLTTA